MHAVLLQRACATQLSAMAAGPLQTWTSDTESLEKAALVWSGSQIEAGWEYWVRQVAALPPPA
jgi:L-fuculose-phosphate aldolase